MIRQGLKSPDGVLSHCRWELRSLVGTAVSVDQGYLGAEGVLFIVFANLDYQFIVDFSALTLIAVFSPGLEMRHPGIYIVSIGFDVNSLPPEALKSARSSIMPATE